jgi:hypothetical protein
MIKVFKFRAQAIFNFLEKIHHLVRETFFIILHLILQLLIFKLIDLNFLNSLVYFSINLSDSYALYLFMLFTSLLSAKRRIQNKNFNFGYVAG